jgi:hypothetical protein
VGEPTTPQDRLPTAEEAFAERVAPLLELVERWRARIVSEAQGWPTVPLSGLDPDDPRRPWQRGSPRSCCGRTAT